MRRPAFSCLPAAAQGKEDIDAPVGDDRIGGGQRGFRVGEVGLRGEERQQVGPAEAIEPPRLIGRITTTMQVVNYGAIPLGAVLGGVLAEALGFRPALWLLFAGLVASSLVLLALPVRGLRDLPSRPAPHIHKALAEVS